MAPLSQTGRYDLRARSPRQTTLSKWTRADSAVTKPILTKRIRPFIKRLNEEKIQGCDKKMLKVDPIYDVLLALLCLSSSVPVF